VKEIPHLGKKKRGPGGRKKAPEKQRAKNRFAARTIKSQPRAIGAGAEKTQGRGNKTTGGRRGQGPGGKNCQKKTPQKLPKKRNER